MISSSSAERRRCAFELCQDRGISAAEMAPLFGLDEQQFLRALKRDGLSFDELEKKSRQLRLAERIMKVLQKEVEALTTLGDGALSKTKLEALAQLARTIERVGDLQEKFAVERLSVSVGLNADELRTVLTRIDERINELADMRARELVQQQSERKGIEGGVPGMDAPGEANPAAAAL